MEIPEGKVYELLPAGTYNATLIRILDLGTQKSNNPKFKDTRKIRLYFEVAVERTEEGDPFVLFREYNFTNNKDSHLMKDLTGWLNLKTTEGFDIDTILGKAAQISVTHSSNGKYANITAVVAPLKGTKLPKTVNALSSLYLTKELFDKPTFDGLSQKLQTSIAGTKEYAEATAPKGKAAAKPAAVKTAAKKK
jgi:hypothetical protein